MIAIGIDNLAPPGAWFTQRSKPYAALRLAYGYAYIPPAGVEGLPSMAFVVSL